MFLPYNLRFTATTVLSIAVLPTAVQSPVLPHVFHDSKLSGTRVNALIPGEARRKRPCHPRGCPATL